MAISELNKFFKNFISEYNNYTNEDIKILSNEQQFLYLYSFYHYFNADPSKFDELKKGDVYTPFSSDHITGLFLDDESDNGDIDLIISIFVDKGETFDYSQVLKSIIDADENFVGKNKKNRSKIKDALDEIRSTEQQTKRAYNLKVITNHIPKASERAKNNKSFNAYFEDFKSYNVNFSISPITYGDEITFEILEIENPKEYVDVASLRIDSPSNQVIFGKEKSLLTNISALSLKSVYQLYGYRGLFAQNLRYYVKNAKIDGKIIDSIKNHPENFWYYNNGIIIICSDYEISDKSISIHNFSIINGGQTTKLIGETDFSRDFFIQCKIIKNKFEDTDQNLDFIAAVAEASNTQKPIKEKDLIANRVEQRRLKQQLAQAGIYVQIKRGEKVNKKLYPASWQNTTNEEIGQFLLSFMYQTPGTARSNKSSIWNTKDRYSNIFEKSYSDLLIRDLLKIKAFYKLWTVEVKKSTNAKEDSTKISLVNNSMFFMTAAIGLTLKMMFNKDLISKTQITTSEKRIELISKYDITHPIFKEDCTDKELFFDLFNIIYVKVLRPAYDACKDAKPSMNCSNYTKLNTSYNNYVFGALMTEIRFRCFFEEIKSRRNLFYTPTQKDVNRNKQMSSQN